MRDIRSKKEYGAYYTPREIAAFLINWAVRAPTDLVLDPGCGEGIFLGEAYHKLLELGADPTLALNQIYGVELDPEAHCQSLEDLERITDRHPSTIFNANFFEVGQLYGPSLPMFDAVVGNPPYIRYQFFNGAMREIALQAARQAGVLMPQLTSSWAPYLIHAVSFLKDTGRLAMVIPAELLHVSYAAPVRDFLMKRFRSVTVITFEERVFPGVLEETALLLADRIGELAGLRVMRLHNLYDLKNWDKALNQVHTAFIEAAEEKWLRYLLPQYDYALYTDLVKYIGLVDLKEVAHVDIGVVTGNNAYFLLTAEEARRWQIESRFRVKAIHRAADLPGVVLSIKDWQDLKRHDQKCYLLQADASPDELSQYPVWSYIKHGV